MSRASDRYDDMDLSDFEELLADKPHDEKWELIGGRVVKMMVGARWEHNLIVQNLSAGLLARLRASRADCRTLVESFRLKSRALESSMLPDILVHCGPLLPGATSVEDPTVLVEVLSDGSVGRDRVEKCRVYQRMPALRHYVLVERDKPIVEIFDRQGDARFAHRVVEGLDAALELPALAMSVPLSEIYRDVLAP